jgi:DNA-directed RNA polymerase specialized sigma24 family protein/CheY-like chemotaxis protein
MTRILIVDDEPLVAAAVLAVLDEYELDAETATDRGTAEAMLASEFFPVILADLRLRSEEEGFRLLESIRRISPRSRVASMTGYATPDTEARLRDLGSRLVLHKPIGNEELIAVMRELLAEVERADGDDLEQVYESTIKTLRSISRGRYRFPAEDAEELIQEAWCLFLEKRQSIRTPKAWLSGTIANLCRQEINRLTRERSRSETMAEPSVDSVDDAVIAVRQGLAKIDARSRMLCEMIGLEQRSYDDVSAAAGLPLGSIGPLYMRAKSKLRLAFAN